MDFLVLTFGMIVAIASDDPATKYSAAFLTGMAGSLGWRGVGLSSVWCAVGVSGRDGGTPVGERFRGRRSKRRSLFRLRRGGRSSA